MPPPRSGPAGWPAGAAASHAYRWSRRHARAALGISGHDLELQWRNQLLLDYRQLVQKTEQKVYSASTARVVGLVNAICNQAGNLLSRSRTEAGPSRQSIAVVFPGISNTID